MNKNFNNILKYICINAMNIWYEKYDMIYDMKNTNWFMNMIYDLDFFYERLLSSFIVTYEELTKLSERLTPKNDTHPERV